MSFFGISDWGIDLDYCDTEWFALEMDRDHSVGFEIASKYCISDSFVDHDGYSISSKGFLLRESFPRQVDKESRGPQGERGLEFSRRKKGQTFFSFSTFLRII